MAENREKLVLLRIRDVAKDVSPRNSCLQWDSTEWIWSMAVTGDSGLSHLAGVTSTQFPHGLSPSRELLAP